MSLAQESVGGDGNAIYGGYYLGDEFTAQGSSITRLTVWMKQAANAAVTLSVIEGDAITDPVVGTATIAAGVSGKVAVEPARPIAVTPGEHYILKVNAPAATTGQAELIPTTNGGIYARDGSNGNADYRHYGWRMALQVDFCGAGVGGCPLGAPASFVQDSVGGPGNAIYGAYYLGDAFVAQGSSITRLAAWLSQAADAPVTFSVIEGRSVGGTVVGTATAPAGASGKVTVVPSRPIAVRAGGDYILKVNAPAATRGQAELIPTSSGGVYVRDGSNGNTDYRHYGYRMALHLDFCGGRLTTDSFPPSSGGFGPVHGSHLAAESFTASDAVLHTASIWLTAANNGPLALSVHRDTPTGVQVAVATLGPGTVGKRSVVFTPSGELRTGATYVLRVAPASVETSTGIVAQRASDPAQQGYDESGPVSEDMALELSFGPAQASSDDLTVDDCTDRLAFPTGYVSSVETALRSKPDVWGNALLATTGGPTYDDVERYLLPLRYVGKPAGTAGTQLTDSGVFYLPFGAPGTDFSQPAALHVADGSQIVSRTASGRRATVFVGRAGTERFGLCEARLQEPELADGYQPVLEVSYRDADGVEYTQESFVAHLPGTRTPASFVRVTADQGASGVDEVELRIDTGDSGLADAGGSLTANGSAYLYKTSGATLEGGSRLRWTLDLSDGLAHAVYVVRPINPASPSTFTAGASSHGAALTALKSDWNTRLASGATFEVPEQRVMEAQRNLLIQNLQLGWRYSYGNAYEVFYQPESSSAVHRLAEYGFTAEGKAGLQALLPMTKGTGYPNWERGEKLSHAAAYWFLTGDTAFIRANTPTYESYMSAMAADLAADPNGLLPKEFEGGDIPTRIYGAHTQTVGWRGMRDMALVWRLIGETRLAATYEPVASSFGGALRRAIDSSKVSVGTTASFIPHDLLSGELPYDPITSTQLGSYWNLLNPYVLASGMIAPGSAEAARAWAYARDEGALMLGLQRFNYVGTPIGSVAPNPLPGYQTSGDDNVYAVERMRFLAAQDEADQMVLALYGKLAHGMTRKTFVSGEGHSIGPVAGQYFRSMYLPPNNANNDFFLVTLREMLVHVREGADGTPNGLRLAHATPRGWLADGKSITVADAPTPFGDVAYSIHSRIASGELDVQLTLPSSALLTDARLRLRLPAGHAIDTVTVVGRSTTVPFSGETLDLAGLTGTVELLVDLR